MSLFIKRTFTTVKMVKQVSVEGFDNFMKVASENSGKDIFVLFTGSVDEATGKSWCPDCVTADPVVEKEAEKAPEDSVFITCHVGPRAFWKDQANAFRQNEKLRLTAVPTLLKYGTPQRLIEGDCAKANLVSMFFEED